MHTFTKLKFHNTLSHKEVRQANEALQNTMYVLKTTLMMQIELNVRLKCSLKNQLSGT